MSALPAAFPCSCCCIPQRSLSFIWAPSVLLVLVLVLVLLRGARCMGGRRGRLCSLHQTRFVVSSVSHPVTHLHTHTHTHAHTHTHSHTHGALNVNSLQRALFGGTRRQHREINWCLHRRSQV